jgi:TonB family protein
MSPEAIVLAIGLHAVAALALWYLAEHAPTIVPREDPIEVTIERSPPKPPKPPPPPPPQQAQPKPIPPPPPIEGLKPPAEKEADKATSVRPSAAAPKDIAAPPQRSLDEMVPKPADQPKPPTETAMVAPNPPSPVPPADRPTLQPLPKPAPGPTVEPLPPRPTPPVEKPPTVARPQPQPQPQRAPPPPSITPHQQPRPSPLVAPRPQSQPPAVARHQAAPTEPSSPFVNPAAEHARATAEQNYLWQVVSKLRGYRYHADVPVKEGLTVVQVIIARDGRLLDAQVVSSSGIPAMDQGVLAGIRQGSPYAPLPASVSGPSARFRLPLVSVPDER